MKRVVGGSGKRGAEVVVGGVCGMQQADTDTAFGAARVDRENVPSKVERCKGEKVGYTGCRTQLGLGAAGVDT